MRSDNRNADQLRPIAVEYGIQPHAAGSALIRMGNTQVICAVSIEEQVPPFLAGAGQSWITAEYGILPCATDKRFRRERNGAGGRTMEIQRLIGRSLRMMVDLRELGERTLRVDCDVLNADGGTRTAAITGGALALRQAIDRLWNFGLLASRPDILPVAAVSAGLVDGIPMLDLDYEEDSRAGVDANFVMGSDGRWIEMGMTAEEHSFSQDELMALTKLARQGIEELFNRFWREPERGDM